jgi:hypothetical protein
MPSQIIRNIVIKFREKLEQESRKYVDIEFENLRAKVNAKREEDSLPVEFIMWGLSGNYFRRFFVGQFTHFVTNRKILEHFPTKYD